MKQPRPRSKAKAPARKSKKRGNPILDILKNMDPDLVAALQQTMQDEMGFGAEGVGGQDPVDLFAEYLKTCARGDADDPRRAELSTDLIIELGDLKIASNGGDREARGKIQAVLDLLDQAIEDHSIHPVDMMLTGKILSDAGWVVPESLKHAIAESLRAASPDPNGLAIAANSVVSSVLELAEQEGQDPFDIHEHLNSLLAGFPPEASAMMLAEVFAGKKAAIDQALAGFLLHPDAVLAQAVAEALAASAGRAPVESLTVERLVRMRPWLPQSRQAQLDVAIRAMRSNALPPVKSELPKIIKCYASVCDGSGTRSLLVTQRLGAQYQLATAMMKPSGVADAVVLRELPKSAIDDFVVQMKSTMPVAETDLAGVARMLGLAIADNFASGNLPPFKLVDVVESLGLGPIHPDQASPAEIIEGLLADLPAEQTNAAAAARAHAEILDSDIKYQWFETGEKVEDFLYPIKGTRARVAKFLRDYLPERRHFWARQCAISALAMRGNDKTRHLPWKQLALVGRDIASNVPLDQIPLMKQIADVSVRAFEGQL